MQDPFLLFVLRLMTGIALGGDYSVGTTLLVEFVPKKYKGALISSLSVVWTVGYVVSILVGTFLGKLRCRCVEVDAGQYRDPSSNRPFAATGYSGVPAMAHSKREERRSMDHL
ncbi:MFS transporter [Brevibacillus brevis]|uniref:MFS transporter n=1 Tax=Brevibacillus brevis TaxID=1393 RepID=A0ABY9TD51_BREBE|nr:MFS transporter [Brevibacillus brevis]WNC17792.1 MFS transporter [Brevibacillus brevis]